MSNEIFTYNKCLSLLYRERKSLCNSIRSHTRALSQVRTSDIQFRPCRTSAADQDDEDWVRLAQTRRSRPVAISERSSPRQCASSPTDRIWMSEIKLTSWHLTTISCQRLPSLSHFLITLMDPLCECIDPAKWHINLKLMPLSTWHRMQPMYRKI
jgi:hypothetical protein